jgi:hypothetical protein
VENRALKQIIVDIRLAILNNLMGEIIIELVLWLALEFRIKKIRLILMVWWIVQLRIGILPREEKQLKILVIWKVLITSLWIIIKNYWAMLIIL